jgi:hypothetical protein
MSYLHIWYIWWVNSNKTWDLNQVPSFPRTSSCHHTLLGAWNRPSSSVVLRNWSHRCRFQVPGLQRIFGRRTLQSVEVIESVHFGIDPSLALKSLVKSWHQSSKMSDLSRSTSIQIWADVFCSESFNLSQRLKCKFTAEASVSWFWDISLTAVWFELLSIFDPRNRQIIQIDSVWWLWDISPLYL